jgi:hypothetical protein
MLDNLSRSSGPLKTLTETWLVHSIGRGDTARILEPLLLTLLDPSTARVSVLHCKIDLCDVIETSNNNYRGFDDRASRSKCHKTFCIALRSRKGLRPSLIFQLDYEGGRLGLAPSLFAKISLGWKCKPGSKHSSLSCQKVNGSTKSFYNVVHSSRFHKVFAITAANGEVIHHVTGGGAESDKYWTDNQVSIS